MILGWLLLLFTKQPIFGLDQFESICRRQNQIFLRYFDLFFIGKKALLEKQKMTALSPFPTMFSKVFFFRVVKSQDGVVKS